MNDLNAIIGVDLVLRLLEYPRSHKLQLDLVGDWEGLQVDILAVRVGFIPEVDVAVVTTLRISLAGAFGRVVERMGFTIGNAHKGPPSYLLTQFIRHVMEVALSVSRQRNIRLSHAWFPSARRG
jgi:hypothetical protein